MKGKAVFLGLSYIDRKYIDEAETQTVCQSKRKTLRRPFVIAAIIALMLFLMGCAVVYLMRVEDLHMGQVTRTQYERNEKQQIISQTEVVLDVISAQGILGTPNFQASQEWLEFCEKYQPDMEAAEEFVIPAGYEVYEAFTQEIVDKVDEICQKYSLKPMGDWAHMQSYQFDVLYEALGIDSLLRGGAEMEAGVGYFTECGNFNVMFSFTLTSEEVDWKQPIGVTMRYADKEYFDTISFSVGNVETVQQRNYALPDGTPVLIVGEGNDTILLYDREDAFISLYFDAYTASGEDVELSDRDIELIAEAIDFTIKPQKPDMAEADRLLAKAETAYQEDLYADMPKTCEEVLAALDQDLYYALVDLNGDGEDEILVGMDGESFGQIYTKIGGSYILYTMLWTDPVEEFTDPDFGKMKCAMYLCEDNVYEVCKIYKSGSTSHAYYRLEKDAQKNGISDVDFVRYDAETGSWHSLPLDRIYDAAEDAYVPYDRNDTITEAEANTVMEAHPRIDLELKPISEFFEK